MRKKIIFMLINMNVGGTEKALLNMINEIPKEKYNITVFMLEKYGGFLDYIPPHVEIKYLIDYQKIKNTLNDPPLMTSLYFFRKGMIFQGVSILFLHIITKILNNRSLFYRYIIRKYPALDEEYDFAIAYDGPNDFISYFILKKIKAKRKFQWIHYDISKIGFNEKFASKVYSKFDKIFIVSKEARNKLIDLLPSLRGKTEVFLNIASPRAISCQSKIGPGFDDSFEGIRILTVGRLSPEKGHDLAIHALAKLVSDGYKVKWYCVGEGQSRKDYERLIKEYKLEDQFILLGAHPNPYTYIDQCDIYVQPSRHEGYCITLMEARLLGKPIITTCFTGANEQINNGKNGIIVDIDDNEIYQAIKKLIHDINLRNELSENLNKESIELQNIGRKQIDFQI